MSRLARPLLAWVFLAGISAPLGAQQGGATLLVRVYVAGSGAPIQDAEVILDESTLLGITGTNGSLRVGIPTVGEHRLRVRFIGFLTYDQRVSFEPGVLTEKVIPLNATPIELDSMTVVGYRGTLAVNMKAFEERKARGIGHFLTRRDIEKAKPHVFSDVLRLIPGMRFDCAAFRDDCQAGMESAPGSGAQTFREGGLRGPLQSQGCPIQYYVDGHYEPHANVNDLNPDDMAAVEVYVHGAQAPARYSLRKNARCGVVLVWMRQSLGGG